MGVTTCLSIISYLSDAHEFIAICMLPRAPRGSIRIDVAFSISTLIFVCPYIFKYFGHVICLSLSMFYIWSRLGILCLSSMTFCGEVCSIHLSVIKFDNALMTCNVWFFLVTLVSSTNKTDWYGIIDMLLMVVLTTYTLYN
jgi:hypothetical protein